MDEYKGILKIFDEKFFPFIVAISIKKLILKFENATGEKKKFISIPDHKT